MARHERATREVEMKKLIFFMCLSAIMTGCISQPSTPSNDDVLLSFDDLATEITVGLEAWDDVVADRRQTDTQMGTP